MNIERFQKILEAYGSQEENWPSSERREAQLFVQDRADAQQLLQEHHRLDIRLDEYLPRQSMASRDKILANLSISRMDAFLNWLVPRFKTEIWHPVLAGSIPLVIGIIIGTNVWTVTDDTYGAESADNWDSEDVYFLALDESQIPMGLIND
jgi:hypothetical protein